MDFYIFALAIAFLTIMWVMCYILEKQYNKLEEKLNKVLQEVKSLKKK